MIIVTWKWCFVGGKWGAVTFIAGETPSGTAYKIGYPGCYVRSDDINYVLNKEIETYCPHSGRGMTKPVKKGLAPAGVFPPPNIEIEERVEIKKYVAPIIETIDIPISPEVSEEETPIEKETKAKRPKRGRPAKRQIEI